MRILISALAALGVLLAGSYAASAVSVPETHIVSGTPQMCNGTAWEWTPDGSVVYDNVLMPGTRVCLDVDGNGFSVSQEDQPQANWNAFPSDFYGCWYLVCSKGWKPLQISMLASLKMTLHTHYRCSGISGDDSTDIWGWKQDPHHGGTTPDGFELMVFMRECGVARKGGTEVRIDGTRWWYQNWVQTINGITHRYLQFRVIGRGHKYWIGRHKPSVRKLPILPFLRRAHIPRSWWIGCFKAGFEMVQGGKGIGVSKLALYIRNIQMLQPPPKRGKS